MVRFNLKEIFKAYSKIHDDQKWDRLWNEFVKINNRRLRKKPKVIK